MLYTLTHTHTEAAFRLVDGTHTWMCTKFNRSKCSESFETGFTELVKRRKSTKRSLRGCPKLAALNACTPVCCFESVIHWHWCNLAASDGKALSLSDSFCFYDRTNLYVHTVRISLCGSVIGLQSLSMDSDSYGSVRLLISAERSVPILDYKGGKWMLNIRLRCVRRGHLVETHQRAQSPLCRTYIHY